MVKYECSCGDRIKYGAISLCNKCLTKNCTNPIYEIKLNGNKSIVTKERLYSEQKGEKELSNYKVVLNCKGFRLTNRT